MNVPDHILSPTVHETRIHDHFNGRVRYDGAKPVFETPLVLLAFTNRCGSNLFAEHLRNTGVIGGLREVTNHPRVTRFSDEAGIGSYDAFFRSEAAAVIDSGKIYGIKASTAQIAMLYRWNIPAMFSGVAVYHVIRSSMIDQAVSMHIAKHTGRWSTNGAVIGQLNAPRKEPADVPFDFQDISKYMERAEQQNIATRLLVSALNLPCETFVYEAFAPDPVPHLTRALALLGHEAKIDFVPEPRIKKQANARNEALISAYRQHLRTALTSA